MTQKTNTGWRDPLLAVIGLAALVPLSALRRGSPLSFVFSSGYRAGVEQELALTALVALALMAAGAFGVWEVSRSSTAAAVAVAVTTIAIGVGLAAFGNHQANRALGPSGPELAAIEEFVPPAGARVSSTGRGLSDVPEVTRYWTVPGTFDDVCRQVAEEFRRWISPVTDVQDHGSCYLKAERDEKPVELTVNDRSETPGQILIGLTVSRA